jgi:hypothetical protein
MLSLDGGKILYYLFKAFLFSQARIESGCLFFTSISLYVRKTQLVMRSQQLRNGSKLSSVVYDQYSLPEIRRFRESPQPAFATL